MVQVYHQCSARAEMPLDTFEAHYLVLGCVEILEGMPRNSNKLERFVQLE
jgi:hypothetical protein